MTKTKRTIEIRSYCAQCHSTCPIICTVEDGKFTKVSRDPNHPNSAPLCPKGLAGPELVYSSQRLRHPLRRTRPKSDSDPGWERISWDEAMEIIVEELSALKETDGAHSVVFNRPGPSGSPALDYTAWVERLAACFGSPNALATGHVCKWHRDVGSKHTYGWQTLPGPDFENTALLLIWGHDPYCSGRCNVRDFEHAAKRGAQLVVIDPRRTRLARNADLWLQIRPGTDGALILGLIHLLLKQRAYDETFVKAWTNAPFLVRNDNEALLTSDDLAMEPRGAYVVWDKAKNDIAFYRPDLMAYDRSGVDTALSGSYAVKTAGENPIQVRPVFDHLRELASAYTPETVASATGVSVENIMTLAGYLERIRPVSYYSFNGIEQHSNAMQTNRALCILYGLTGNLDKSGGNVFFPTVPAPEIYDPKVLPPEIHQLRLGFKKRPLGPAARSIQAYEVFESVLTGKPYPVKAMVAFGGNIVTANSNSRVAREALRRLKFYAHADLCMTPSAELADVVLPASTFYESSHVRLGFSNLLSARTHVQYRPPIILPLYETRPDMEIMFDLAQRLGLGEYFWDGDVEAAFNDQLEFLDFDLADLKKTPGGITVNLPLTYGKYAAVERTTGRPKGFKTPCGRLEIFSQRFKDHGYDPLPAYREPAMKSASNPETTETYPLILTCSKLLHFCHGQHRAIPQLRKAVPHPFVEINPEKARELNIENEEWVSVETPSGKIRVKAKLTDGIAVDVVCVQNGWWQDCPELDLPGYDPYSSEGANSNLLYSTECIDPISGSLPYKSYICRVVKI